MQPVASAKSANQQCFSLKINLASNTFNQPDQINPNEQSDDLSIPP
jgi:hypothetical protein